MVIMKQIFKETTSGASIARTGTREFSQAMLKRNLLQSFAPSEALDWGYLQGSKIKADVWEEKTMYS